MVRAVVEATTVDLEGRRGTRLPQTKAATLPAGRPLATLREYRRDSHRRCVRVEGWLFRRAIINPFSVLLLGNASLVSFLNVSAECALGGIGGEYPLLVGHVSGDLE